MDKQQAAEAHVQKNGLKVGAIRKADYIAGWDACDAQQSPSDAVAFSEWMDKERNKKRGLWEDLTIWSSENACQKMYKLFNPSGQAPQLAVDKKICPLCGSDKVVMFDSDNDLCQTCKKWFPAVGKIKVSAPQAAGPVWVKPDIRYNNNLPPAGKDVFIRYDNGSVKDACDAEIIKALYWKGFKDIEWLDESNTQQVFTREQVEEIAAQAMKYGGIWPSSEGIAEWLNTNYLVK